MKRWLRAAAFTLCTALVGLLMYGLVSSLTASAQLPIFFANETADHKYDRALRSSIRTFQDRTHIQLAIVLKDRLPPMTTIETYAAETFKQTAVGERSHGKGILLLWSEQERLFKLEVGYDLEPIFPMRFATGWKKARALSCFRIRLLPGAIS